MSDAVRPFVRLYYVDFQRDYRAVLYDPTALSTYMRLLILADQAWPAMPGLPKAVRRADLKMLTDCGLITVSEGDIYVVKGYHKEREERAQKGRAAVAKRSDRSKEVPTLVEPDYKESILRVRVTGTGVGTGSSEGGPGGTEPDPIDAFNLRTGSFPVGKIRTWINDIAKAHGDGRTARLIAATPLTDPDVRVYLRAITNILRAEDHAATKAELATEQRAVAEKRRPILVRKPEEDISDEEAAQRAAEYRREFGGASA